MGGPKKSLIILILILGILLRSYYPITEPYVIGNDSYYHLRIAEYFVQNNQLPEIDESYAGARPYTYFPFFHIALGLLGKILPLTLIAKLIPIILSTIYLLIAFLIFKKEIPLFLIATMPVLLFKQAGYLLTDGLSLVLIALLTYSFQKRNFFIFFISILAYSITHASALLFSIFFLFIIFIERKNNALSFSLPCFISLLIILLFHPEVYIGHLNNIPSQISSMIFAFNGLSYLAILELGIGVSIGITLLILSIYQIKIKDKDTYYFILLSPILLFLLKIITLDRALAYSAIPLAYFAYKGITIMKSRLKTIIILLVIIGSLFSAILAIKELSWAVMSEKEHDSLLFLSENCKDKTVLTYKFGHRVAAYGCKVYFDDIYYTDSRERYDNLLSIYRFEDDPQDISFILVHDTTRTDFPDFNKKAQKSEKLNLIFNNGEIQIYEVI